MKKKPTPREVTEKAIQKGVDHANRVHQDWSDQAYAFLQKFIKSNTKFQCEDVRYASQGVVPVPPSQRAWGSLIRKAAKAGLIKHVAYRNVKNINAHGAISSVWHKI